MSVAAIFLIAALILFIIAAAGVSSPRINLVAAGLACIAVYLLLGAGAL